METPTSHGEKPCFPVKKVIRYKAKSYGALSGEHAMMKELLNGPITCGIACSEEFTYNYSAGIFEDKTNFMDLDHSVEVVGWGEQNGVKYWHIRNSWGSYWGEDGFFRIVRGVNNLAIESDCHYVVPDVSQEELVWNENPAYGGSLWGIKPFSESGKKIIIPSTDEITGNSDQLHSHDDLPVDEEVLIDSSSWISSLPLLLVIALASTALVYQVALRYRKRTYSPIV